MSYLTTNQFDRIVTMPISLPQTELRRQRYLHVGVYPVALGQRLELRSLTLHLLKILTPGVGAILDNTVSGLCSVGIVIGSMATSVIGQVSINGLGASTWTADQPVIITAPGTYRVVAFNNSSNIDVSLAVTGSMKLYH